MFHGNALPPRRRGFLREMIELVTRDAPDVVCLQEVPVWGIARLEEWSSMQVLAVVARSPRLPGRTAARVTRWNQGLFRSAFVGQANAVLVAPHLAAEDRGHLQISDHGRERRVVQGVAVGARYLIANVHANRGREVAQVELERSRVFAETASREAEIVVLAGDFNLSDFELDGYSAPTEGIDHVLVRRASVSAPLVWPIERRTENGVVLSDHAPVELTIG